MSVFKRIGKKTYPTQNIWHKKHVGASLGELVRLLPLLTCDYSVSAHITPPPPPLDIYSSTHCCECYISVCVFECVKRFCLVWLFCGEEETRIAEMMGVSLPACGQVSKHSLWSIKLFFVIPNLHICKWIIFKPLYEYLKGIFFAFQTGRN